MAHLYRCASCALLLLLGAAAAAAPPRTAPANAKPQPMAGEFQARSAGDFCNSVGVCMHLGWTGTNYVNDFPVVGKLLLESGIRQVRTDPVVIPQGTKNVQELAQRGVKFDFIVHGDGKPESISRLLSHINRNFAGSVRFIEGYNEPDVSFPVAKGESRNDPQTWVPGARAWMQEFYRQCKADPALKRIPILGCAPAYPNKAAPLIGDCTKFVDFGNLHPYPGGRAPEVSIGEYLGWIKPMYGDLQCATTEVGYHSALNNPPNQHRPTSIEAETVYMPRLYLEHFRIGVLCSYKYQFLDHQDEAGATAHGQPLQEAHFGYVGYDLKPKPAYYAVKNLLTILNDEKPAKFQPKSIKYQINGPRDELRHLLLQKSDGRLYLALWRAVTIWDPNKRVAVPAADARVTVDFPRPVKVVRIYDPTKSAEPVATERSVKSLPLTLGPKALILELAAK